MASSSSSAALPPDAYEDRRATVIGTVAFCLAWATFMVGSRIWTRSFIINQLGIDDYLCIVALLVTYGSGIAIAHMTTYGLGRHVYVMESANIPLYLKDFYVSIVLYCSSLLFIKMTFLFQYYRVLAVQHMRKVYIGCMVVVGGWGLSQVMVGIFTCNPVSGFWDSSIPSTCIPDLPQWYINAAGNIVTDVVVFALPLPALWKLQLARQSRNLLIAIFSLGFFTVVISIIRIQYLKLFEDFPWENVEPSLWSVGELTSALTCACLPTLRPLMVRYVPRLASRITKGYASTGSGGGSGSGGSRSRRWTGAEPSALESGVGGNRAGGGRTRTGSTGGVDDGSVWMTGSEVELAQAGSKTNPFEVHIVHELRIGVEMGGPSGHGGFGGYMTAAGLE